MPNLSQLRRLKPYLTAPFNPNVDEESQVGTVAPQVLKRLKDIVSTPQEQPVVNQPENDVVGRMSAAYRALMNQPDPSVSTPATSAPLIRLPTIDMQNQGVAANPEFTRPRRVLPNFADTPVDLAAPSVAVNQSPLAKFPGLMQRPEDVGPRPDTTSQINYLQNQPIEKGQGGFGHRLMRGLKLAGERALDSLGQTGNPLVALGAAAEGGVEGVADRSSQQKYLRQHELKRLRGVQEREFETEGARTKLDLMRSQIGENQSQALARLHPRPDYSSPIETDNGVVVYDQHNPSAPPLTMPFKLKPKDVPYDIKQNEKGEYVGINPRNPTQVVGTGVKAPQKEKPRLSETILPSGAKVMLTDAQLANYESALSGRDETARREAEQVAKENSKINYDNIKQERGEAQKYVQGLNDTIMALGDAQRTIQTLGPILDKTPEGSRNAKDVTALATAYADRARLEQEMSAKGEFLANNYGEHIVRRADGTYALKPAPAREPLPTRPLRGRNYVAPKVSKGELERLMQ